MIVLSKIRELDLSAAPAEGRPMHVSAASGLVRINSIIYVIADDELHLGMFSAEGRTPGHLVQLFEGELPDSNPDRKRHKPDFEALTLLPAFEDYPHGALLALGSGSRRNRRIGALVGLDACGTLRGSPHVVDLSPLLVPLDDAFPKVNIEGAIVNGNEVRLFQRGNKRNSENAIIRFRLSAVLDTLHSARASVVKPLTIDLFDLGEVDGIPFCFTDAAALPGGDMVFTAVAEDTDDAHDNGPCVGAAIGMADNSGHLRWLRRLERPCKIEGVDARIDGAVIRLLLVTDADDASVPAGLLSAMIG